MFKKIEISLMCGKFSTVNIFFSILDIFNNSFTVKISNLIRVYLLRFFFSQLNSWYLWSGQMTNFTEEYLLWHWFGTVMTCIKRGIVKSVVR